MKDLTVFILTHNRGELLLQTLDSVLNQTCNDFKIIVSDNSNNNDTRELLNTKNYLDRFIYRKRDKEYTPFEHFNLCLKEVDTKYFMLFHDDDLMFENMIEELYQNIEKKNFAAVCCNANYLCNTKKSGKKLIKSCNRINLIKNAYDLLKMYAKGQIFPFPSYMYSKEIIGDEIFVNDCGKYSDVSWLLRILQKGAICGLETSLMYYRIHGNQDSAQYDYCSQLKLIKKFRKTSEIRKKTKILNEYRIDQILYLEKIKEKKCRNNHIVIKYGKLKLKCIIFIKIVLGKI